MICNNLFVVMLVGIIFLPCKKIFAYNPDCTHPVLSQRAAELYIEQFGARFTVPQINRLIQGSYHEDIGVNPYFRSTNHFYDIHNQREWRDPIALDLGAYFLSACFYDAFKRGNIHTAKEWALNPSYQQLSWKTWDIKPCSYDGDYSWPTLLKLQERNESSGEVFYALGHILHLVQDLTVPAHTRNDSHFPGNPDNLEEYAKEVCPQIPDVKQLYNQGLRPLLVDDVGKNFDELALYTYAHYFSNDTIFSGEYDLPLSTRRAMVTLANGEEHTYLYATDSSSVRYGLPLEYRLVEVNTFLEQFFPNQPQIIYFLCKVCIKDYWERTMRKSIAYGAGVLRKFVLETESSNACEPQIKCKPGDVRCKGNAVEVCNNDGCGWGSMQACMFGCANGACVNPPSCTDTCRTAGKNCGNYMGCDCGNCGASQICSNNTCVDCGGTGESCCVGKTCSGSLVCDNGNNTCRNDTTPMATVYRFVDQCSSAHWSSANGSCYPASMTPKQGCAMCLKPDVINFGCAPASASCWVREDGQVFSLYMQDPGYGSFSKVSHCFEGGANTYSLSGCTSYGDPNVLGWISNTMNARFSKPLTRCEWNTGFVTEQFLSRFPIDECTKPGRSILSPNPLGYVP